MIEVKLTFPDAAELVAYFLGNAAAQVKLPPDTSAAVTSEKQAAAIASTAAGKAAKDKAEKPAKSPETPVEALKQAVEDAKPARTYEASGIPQKIAKQAAKDKPAMIALLEKFNARDGEGKLTGKVLKPEQFDDFEKQLDALLAPAEDLG